MIVAQITDLHVKRKGHLLHHMINTAKSLRRCVERLNELDPRPDVIVATGDLTESGKRKEYARLRDVLERSEIPVYLMPGNHDDRERLRDAFPDHAYLPERDAPLSYVLESFPVRIVALDSTDPGYRGGCFDEQRERWLRARLREAPSRPTFLFMHHPPFLTGIRQLDNDPYRRVEVLGEVVRANPQIQLVGAGHIHRAMQVRWQGTMACTAPSTAHQIVLELREKQPLGMTLEPPGFLLHVWDPDYGTVTHVCATERFKTRWL